MIDNLLREPVTDAIGWALVHFVWQGAAIGLVAAVALRLLRHSAADVRYVVAAIALAVMATWPAVTVVQALRVPVTEVAIGGAALPESSLAATAMQPPAIDDGCSGCEAGSPVSRRLESLLPLAVFGWMLGVCALALRLGGGWIAVQRLRMTSSHPTDRGLLGTVRRLTHQLHISRPVALLQSASVDVPTVIGWVRPVILLPVGTLAGLSPLQVEAILAHELAHIRRHDYLVNLLQTLVETLLFYHPAVWWLSRRIRIEREHCCDDLAVSLCGDPVVYAEALADLEEVRGAGSRLVMAASGGSLVERVRRLLAAPAPHAGRGPAWIAAASAMLLIGAVVATPGARNADGPTFDDREPLEVLQPSATEDVTVTGQGMPTPPTPPTPPAPPAPPDQSLSHEVRSGKGTISWSNDGEKIVVNYEGAFTVNDSDTDIATLSPGGTVRISDGAWLRRRTVEFTAAADGTITRRFTVGGGERPFEPEGREWLARVFPRFVRQSGINADVRVARFLSKGGIDAVLAEISLIDGSYGKRRYFTELMKQAPLDAATARRILEQAGREVSSDYELSRLLIDVGQRVVLDEDGRAAYFAAARRIRSDHELRQVYTAALERATVPEPLLVSLLEGTRDLESDYEAATLLVDVVKRYPVEGAARGPFFEAVQGVDSSYERARVLQRLLRRTDLSEATLVTIISEAGRISSSHEASQVLIAAARGRQLTGDAREAYLRAADRLSDHEKGQALSALR